MLRVSGTIIIILGRKDVPLQEMKRNAHRKAILLMLPDKACLDVLFPASVVPAILREKEGEYRHFANVSVPV